MISILDVSLPIISFVLFSLLTIPVTKTIRKRKSKRTALSFGWFSVIFITAIAAVANLAIKYYEQSSLQPFLNITLTNETHTMFSSAFLIDAISIYMAVIFTMVGAVVFLYSIFYIDLSEKLSERYYSVMLIIIGCIIGAAFSGVAKPVSRTHGHPGFDQSRGPALPLSKPPEDARLADCERVAGRS